MEASEANANEVQEVTSGLDENEEALLLGDGTNGLDSEPSKEESPETAADENKTESKDEEKTENKTDDEAKEKTEEKVTTETIMEIGGKKVKKTTGGAKKIPPASVYRTSLSAREALRRDRRRRALEMRRRTLLISNILLEDATNEKLKGVIESCYHCQIRFLQTKVGKRGVLECRFNTVEDATKAEGELKEIVTEERTIGIRNLEESDAPSTWYEVGRELDKYLKAGESGKDESEKDGDKGDKGKDAQEEEEIAACDETKTLVLLNLPLTTTEEMLQAIFSEPQKIRMPLDNTGQCKGHAFLEFETAELATECQTKYEGISIEDDQDDRQIYIQTLKEYKEKSKAKAARNKRSGSRRRSRDTSSSRRLRIQNARRLGTSRLRRGGPFRSRGMSKSIRTRGRDRNWGSSSPRSRGLLDKDRKRDMRSGRRDGFGFDSGMNWGRNMMWNNEMMNSMPNLLNMMSGMPASMMGINPFMGNSVNFQGDNSSRNTDDYRNRKRKMDEPDFFRGDNRRGGVGGPGVWKNRRFEGQDNYGGTSYGDRDRGTRTGYRDRNDNRGFRRY